MKLSAFLSSYMSLYAAGYSTKQIVDLAVSQGFQAIEPFTADDFVTPTQAKELGQYITDKGAIVSCYSACVDILSGDRQTVVSDIRNHIDMAAAMGSPYFHHTIYPHLNLPRKGETSFIEAFHQAETLLPELCKYAADKGVTCCYEDQGMFFNGSAPMLRLAESMQDVPFGIVADLGNIFFVDERPESFIATFSDKIVHVHCKDYLYRDGNDAWPGPDWYMTRNGNFLRNVFPGDGVVGYQRIFRMLQQIGYDGWYSLEYLPPDSVEVAFPKVIATLERIYNSVLAESATAKGI